MSAIPKHRRLLGEAVRGKRKQAELSQERLAEKASLSTVFISRIERGVESPSVDNLLKIAKALGVQVRDLVDGFLNSSSLDSVDKLFQRQHCLPEQFGDFCNVRFPFYPTL